MSETIILAVPEGEENQPSLSNSEQPIQTGEAMGEIKSRLDSLPTLVKLEVQAEISPRLTVVEETQKEILVKLETVQELALILVRVEQLVLALQVEEVEETEEVKEVVEEIAVKELPTPEEKPIKKSLLKSLGIL